MTYSVDPERRLRVLMVMPSYYPVIGGMEIQVERLIPHLRDQGIDSAVLTRRPAGAERTEHRHGADIRRVTVPGGPGTRSIAFTTQGIADIVRNRRAIDIIHAHSILSPTTIAAIAGPLLRKPTVVTAHQSYEPAHLLSKPFGSQRLRIYQRVISRFVSISRDIERLLLDNGTPSSKIVAVPNGIDTCQFRPATGDERSALRASLWLPDELPIAVFAGRLQPVKQVDILLRAWAGVYGGHLLILGDGPERSALVDLTISLQLADRVDFRGMVPNVHEYLRASDIFVLPSSSEGLSVALLEAMASGMLPIATAIGGSTDLIDDGISGLLVTSGDVEGLRHALARALHESDWRRDAAVKARAVAAGVYDVRVVAAKLAGVYRDVMSENGR